MPTPETTSPVAPVSTLDRIALVEATLLAIDRPLPPARLVEALESCGDTESTTADIESDIASLNAGYESEGRAIRIERTPDGYRAMTLPAAAPVIAAIAGGRPATRLSKAALETLAVVAYQQPITRAKLEAIRGVASGEVLRALIDRKLITVAGRAEEIGRPMLYGTTRDFLRHFGLTGLRDLPDLAGGMPDVVETESADAPNQG